MHPIFYYQFVKRIKTLNSQINSGENLKYLFRHTRLFKIIASVIILSFLAYDLAWACPEGGKDHAKSYPAGDDSNLAVPGLQKKEVLARLRAGLIVKLIEKQSALKDHLADLTLSDILKWQDSTESQFDGVKFEVVKQRGKMQEVILRLPDESLIIRYYDNSALSSPKTPRGYVDITSDLFSSDTIHPDCQIRRQILKSVKALAAPQKPQESGMTTPIDSISSNSADDDNRRRALISLFVYASPYEEALPFTLMAEPGSEVDIIFLKDTSYVGGRTANLLYFPDVKSSNRIFALTQLSSEGVYAVMVPRWSNDGVSLINPNHRYEFVFRVRTKDGREYYTTGRYNRIAEDRASLYIPDMAETNSANEKIDPIQKSFGPSKSPDALNQSFQFLFSRARARQDIDRHNNDLGQDAIREEMDRAEARGEKTTVQALQMWLDKIAADEELARWNERREEWLKVIREKKLPVIVEEIVIRALAFKGMEKVTNEYLQHFLAPIEENNMSEPPSDLSDEDFLNRIAECLAGENPEFKAGINSAPEAISKASSVIKEFMPLQQAYEVLRKKQKDLFKLRKKDAKDRAHTILDEIDTLKDAPYKMPERIKAAQWREYLILNINEAAFRIERLMAEMGRKGSALNAFAQYLRTWLNDENRFDGIENKGGHVSAISDRVRSISQDPGIDGVTQEKLSKIAKQLTFIANAMERDRNIPDGSPYGIYAILLKEASESHPIAPVDIAKNTVGRVVPEGAAPDDGNLSVEHTIMRDLRILISFGLVKETEGGKVYATSNELEDVEKEAVKLVLKRLGQRPTGEHIEHARAEIDRIRYEKAEYSDVTHFDATMAIIRHTEFMNMRRILLVTQQGHVIGDELIKAAWFPGVLCRENAQLRVDVLASNPDLFKNNPHANLVSRDEVLANGPGTYDAVFVFGRPGDNELDGKLKRISPLIAYSLFHDLIVFRVEQNRVTKSNEDNPITEHCNNKYIYSRLLLSRLIGNIRLQRPVSLYLSENEIISAREIIRYSIATNGNRYNPKRRHIIINPFSRELKKTFSKDFIADLVVRLRNEFPEAELLLVPGMTRESEEVLRDAIADARKILGPGKRPPVQVHKSDASQVTLREIISIINILNPERDLLIGADTSTFHMASCLGKHSITYYLDPYMTPEVWCPNDDYSMSIKGYRLEPQKGIDLIVSKTRKFFDDTRSEIDNELFEPEMQWKVESPIVTSFKLIISQAHKEGFKLLEALTKKPARGSDIGVAAVPRAIPVNVDIFSDIFAKGGNMDIAERFLEILALKQLYLNRHGHAAEFIFISRSGNDALLDAVSRIYDELDVVKHYDLKFRGDKGLKKGFTITDLSDDTSNYNERCLFLTEKVKADDEDSGLYMWSGILDLAVSLTMLMEYEESARSQYYPEIIRLYSTLMQDRSKVVDDSVLQKLLTADIDEARSIAKNFAIRPLSKFNINERRTLYILMRTLWEAA